jgi:hypothetical protein
MSRRITNLEQEIYQLLHFIRQSSSCIRSEIPGAMFIHKDEVRRHVRWPP